MQRGHRAELSSDVVWHGRTEDAARLMRSVDDHCSCRHGAPPGRSAAVCAAHQILADQHTLDHLAFARSVRPRMVDEEWSAPGSTASGGLTAADWSRLMAERVPTRAAPPASPAPTGQPHPPCSGRGAFVTSLLALLFVLCVGGPAYPLDAPIGQPIASWLTR